MKLNLNNENIKNAIRAIFLAGIILVSSSGCKNSILEEEKQKTIPSITQNNKENNNLEQIDSFTTYENFSINHWYVIKYTDGNTQMTRMSTLDNIDINRKIYYYVDAFTGGKVLGKVLYIRDENKYWIMEGEEIESAISIEDYINNHLDLYQENYTKEDMKNIFELIKNDYEKKIDSKDKVLIKENSLY